MTENSDKLRLLNDLPAAKTEDKFHHDVYASIIRDVFFSNKPGLSVGLFGKWGQGKSSIVRVLKESLKDEATVIVFNAWKASGDSIRRQLLLRVLEEIAPNRAIELKRFVGLEIVESLLLTEKERRKKKAGTLLWTMLNPGLWLKMIMPMLVAIAFFLAGFWLVVWALADLQQRGEFCLKLALALFSAAFALSLFVTKTVKQSYYGRLSISQPLSESQKLKYPEQFQEVLEKYVRGYCKKNGKLIIVVDDLDRCSAETVAEALAAIRQFTIDQIADPKDFNCQFLIPCDEQQVVLALESAGHDAGISGARYHDYQSEELLRKFFDVVIRMDEMLPDDLSDFAAEMAAQIGLNEKEARELVDLAGARDPRQIKKLLNSLRISHESIDRRTGHLLPSKDQLEKLAATQRLLVALRETVPEVYNLVAANPALIKGIPTLQADANDDGNQAANALTANLQIDKANLIIGRAGSVSEVTATQLIYGRLDPELRHVPSGGLLTNMFMTGNEKGFSEALVAIRPDDYVKVQAWLQKKVRTVKSDAATRDILRLLLGFAESESEGASEMIAPCIDVLFLETASLSEIFSEFKRYHALKTVWLQLQPNAKDNAIAAIFSNFEKDRAKADNELAFLLEHAKELDNDTASGLRAWMVEEANQESEDEAFVRRLHAYLREEPIRETCYGFAPEVAVLLAGKSEWMDDADEDSSDDSENWPRCNVVITLVGDSEDHAARCLAAIFTGNGQLATPQVLTDSAPGFSSAWRAVSRLLSIVSDEQIQDIYIHIQSWLSHQSQAFGFKSILHNVGYDAFRLSADQISELSRFLAKRLQVHPTETHIIDFIDKAPDDDHLKNGWRSLVSKFTGEYFTWLQAQPALSSQIREVLEQIRTYRWPILEQAENLLVQKLQAANVSTFEPWLDVLAPLVGNRRSNLWGAVKGCVERNQRVKQALATGVRVLWKKEIDPESAAILGGFLIDHQSEIPNYSDEWAQLKEMAGVGRVLESMRKNLPTEAATLVNYRHPLNMIADGFDKLTKNQREAFLNEKVLLLLSGDDTARQMSMEIASNLPSTLKALQKRLKELQKNEELTKDQRELVGEILNKDTL